MIKYIQKIQTDLIYLSELSQLDSELDAISDLLDQIEEKNELLKEQITVLLKDIKEGN